MERTSYLIRRLLLMIPTLIGITLLFAANGISKLIRGESII